MISCTYHVYVLILQLFSLIIKNQIQMSSLNHNMATSKLSSQIFKHYFTHEPLGTQDIISYAVVREKTYQKISQPLPVDHFGTHSPMHCVIIKN